jgi:peroxiredoxin
MALAKGTKAPDFTLISSDKEEVSLADFKGKNVVLLFFPLAFTGGCTTEICTIRDSIAQYNSLNAQVLGISVDSFATLAKFKEEQGGNYPLLSDFNKTVCKAYDCMYDEFVLGMKGVARRASFVIDKDGVIQYSEVVEATEQPTYDAIKAALEGLN